MEQKEVTDGNPSVCALQCNGASDHRRTWYSSGRWYALVDGATLKRNIEDVSRNREITCLHVRSTGGCRSSSTIAWPVDDGRRSLRTFDWRRRADWAGSYACTDRSIVRDITL
jgi:hypothetical protein